MKELPDEHHCSGSTGFQRRLPCSVEALQWRASLDVKEGEIVTVIGPNGAGKTTLLCAAMGLLPSRGSLTLSGERIARPSVEAMVSRGVALVPEKRELFGEMSVEDNLLLGGFYRWRKGQRDQKARMEEVFQIFPRMRERRAQMASTSVRRRTPDAGHRPRIDGAPAPADARRAIARPRAADRARGAASGVVAAQPWRLGAAGRAECARRLAGGRSRLRAGDRRRRAVGPGGRTAA